jgi:ferric-dicitrate binding protein FerR (iron transport regulator)
MGDAVAVTGPTERLPTPGRADPRAAPADTANAEAVTVELPSARRAPEGQEQAPVQRRPGGPWRELTGAITIGLCGLAVVVLGLQVFAWTQPDVPGPGPWVVLGHFGTALAAVLAQRVADRRRGPQAALAMLLVLIACGVAIWYFWWA